MPQSHFGRSTLLQWEPAMHRIIQANIDRFTSLLETEAAKRGLTTRFLIGEGEAGVQACRKNSQTLEIYGDKDFAARSFSRTGRCLPMFDLDQRLYRFLASAPDPTLIVDQSGVILFASAQIELVFGFEPRELLGDRIESLMPERFRTGHTSLFKAYFSAPNPRPMGA